VPPGAAPPGDKGARAAAPAGSLLPADVRARLGPELVRALNIGETVAFVTPASVWASPEAVLAVTDRRLLWLNADAIADLLRAAAAA